ncbi:hypothetical protein [Paenibacillus campinasensis]|uniref:Uncharacterized protein n=1 Tax=Paenibacillus campinasensis TaxID=66347 RepID=A0A268EH34_9BACL|nr:hypothetical protein [Paenibacillus campinasensis]PAD72438.1 hypothetical protein CHH67_22620 [Paenibacillus campinasensis]
MRRIILSELSPEEYRQRIIEEAKKSYELQTRFGGNVEEALDAILTFVYDSAHNRGGYDAENK